MRQHPVIINLLSFILMMSSCAQSAKERNAAIVAQWVGKQLVIPDRLVYTIAGDTINYDPLDADFTIVTYIGPEECRECNMRLLKWKDEIALFNTDPKIDINYLMVVETNNPMEVIRLQKSNQFKFPISIDTIGLFRQTNDTFPNKTELRTFLINNLGEVLAIGSPVLNPNIRKIYLRIAGFEPKSESYPAEVSIQVKSLGLLNFNDSAKVSFSIYNTSQKQLDISGTIESCDCMTTKISGNTISPGDNEIVTLTVHGDSTTSRKSVDVYFEGLEQPLHLKTISFAKKQPAVTQLHQN